jgi:TM2 domain-containing membrane protein YozV
LTKHCPECGSEVKENEKFCQECGTDLNSENEITNSNNGNSEKEIKNDEENSNNETVNVEKSSNNENSEKEIKNDEENSNNETVNVEKSSNNENSEKEIKNDEKSSNSEITYHKGVWRSTIASLIFPGLGQFINGQILKGIVFIVLTFLFTVLSNYVLILSIFYFAFHIYAMYDAYKSAKYINEHNGNYFYNENLKNVDGDVNGN